LALSDSCILVSHCFNCLICISLKAYKVEHLFIGLFATSISSFMVSVKVFGLFCNGVVFLLSFKHSVYILNNSPLSDMSFVNIFSQSDLSSNSQNTVFHRTEIFSFDQVQFINISFMDYIFSVASKKASPYPRLSRFSTAIFYSFYSSVLYLSHLVFRFIFHFEFIFVKGVRFISRLFFF